jgi:hypothetical protein
MRNAVIVATAGTDPTALLALLGQHPEIVAPPALGLSTLLHGTSRDIVRTLRVGRCGAQPAPADYRNSIEFARRTCGSAIDLVFSRLRESTPASTVVVWDPDGLAYPFIEPPDIHVVLLTREPESAARCLAGGVRLAEITASIEEQVACAVARPRAWGLPEEHVLRVDEDNLVKQGAQGGTAGLQRLLRFLNVTSDAAAVRYLLRHRRAAPFGRQQH